MRVDARAGVGRLRGGRGKEVSFRLCRMGLGLGQGLGHRPLQARRSAQKVLGGRSGQRQHSGVRGNHPGCLPAQGGAARGAGVDAALRRVGGGGHLVLVAGGAGVGQQRPDGLVVAVDDVQVGVVDLRAASGRSSVCPSSRHVQSAARLSRVGSAGHAAASSSPGGGVCAAVHVRRAPRHSRTAGTGRRWCPCRRSARPTGSCRWSPPAPGYRSPAAAA